MVSAEDHRLLAPGSKFHAGPFGAAFAFASDATASRIRALSVKLPM
jgi:hypothetical protein